MSVISADTLQLSAVEETTTGVTPPSAQFKVWRTAGESLVFAPQTSESTELGGSGRTSKPANVTGTTVSGDITFELARFAALDEAIAGVLAAQWGTCPLTNLPGGALTTNRITAGNQAKTFTIEKRFPNPAATVGSTLTGTTGAAGAQTVDLTFAGATSVGTGVAKVHVIASTAIDPFEGEWEVHIPVGTAATAAATLLATEIAKSAGAPTTNVVGGVLTLDARVGNTITSIDFRTGSDQFFYQRYKGASYSAINLAISPNNPITGSVSVVGGTPELDSLPVKGALYTPPGSFPVFTAPQVMNLDIGSMGVGTHCWTSLNIALDSQNRGIPCIGSQGDREVVLGTLSATVSGDVYFSDQQILQALLDNTTLGDSVIAMEDAQNNWMRFDFYGMKPTSGQLAAGGTGQDLTIPVTLQPTPVVVCDDGVNNWESGFIISWLNTAPVLPAAPLGTNPLTIVPGTIASDASVVAVSGDPATAAVTATFTYAIDSGADQTFVVNVAKGDTAAVVIGKIETAAGAAGTNDLATSAKSGTSITIEKGAGKTSLDKLTVAIV